jgi:hypothetical protein
MVAVPLEVVVQIAPVCDEKLTARPELALAVSVRLAPMICGPGGVKLITWLACGITEALGADAMLVPALLDAVTVKL